MGAILYGIALSSGAAHIVIRHVRKGNKGAPLNLYRPWLSIKTLHDSLINVRAVVKVYMTKLASHDFNAAWRLYLYSLSSLRPPDYNVHRSELSHEDFERPGERNIPKLKVEIFLNIIIIPVIFPQSVPSGHSCSRLKSFQISELSFGIVPIYISRV